MTSLRLILSLIWLPLWVGCAQTPTVMTYFPDAADSGASSRVWPSPPELPRYRYAGQLVGESNFGPAEQSKPGAGERFLRWLVGLGQDRRVPRELLRPQTGMVDEQGRVLVTDMGRKAVFVFDGQQGKLDIWEGADGGADFVSPVGIEQTGNGEVLVADSELGRVVRLDADGNPLGSIGEGVLDRPTGLTRDPETGSIYVADTGAHDVKVFDGAGRLVRVIGRRGTAPGEFNGPTHLDFHGGRLYVTDTLSARVQILTREGEPLSAFGRRGLWVGELVRPKGVTVDSQGHVYVVESYYDYLLVFDAEGRLLLPIGGTGAAIGQFFLPSGLWSDADDRIFVADMFNGRVVILQFLGS